MSSSLPPCGLYKTLRAINSSVEKGVLVYFHNHSEAGGPVVHLPVSNTHNRWRYDIVAHPIKPGDLDSLQPMKAEGLYRVREHFHPDRERFVPKDALVQLGYNREAAPIIFFPKNVEGANQIEFPDRGLSVPPAVYDLLEPLDLRGPLKSSTVH